MDVHNILTQALHSRSPIVPRIVLSSCVVTWDLLTVLYHHAGNLFQRSTCYSPTCPVETRCVNPLSLFLGVNMKNNFQIDYICPNYIRRPRVRVSRFLSTALGATNSVANTR